MPAAPNVRLQGIVVQYGKSVALRGVDLDLPSGARVAVVGANGAGKSTLLQILSGRRRPDSGRCFVGDVPMPLHRHGAAAEHGIGLIPQHDDLIPAWSVLDNVLLGAEGAKGAAPLPRAAQRKRLIALSAETGLDVEVDANVETLSLAARQRATILRALFRGARVLLLDEPTAVLSPSESADLWRATRRLSDQGATIVFVTHRLNEALAEADRIVVLRGGERTLACTREETDRGALIVAMVGERPAQTPRMSFPAGDEALRLDAPYAFSVRYGEVVGVAGVDGSGQQALVDALVGTGPSAGLRLGGEPASAWTIAQRRAWGLGYVPEDRHRDALALGLTVAQNACLGRQREPGFGAKGLLRRRAMDAWAVRLCEDGEIVGGDPQRVAGGLSGGNQQKLVLERELSRPLRALVACQPTRGLDFETTERIRARLRDRAAECGVVVVSSDLDELRAVADRIVVFYAGRIAGEVPVGAASDARLGQLMTGAA